MTRPAQVSRDLHILPPPLIPTPPPEEPQPPPDESWLPQPLPAEKRGLEELEVPGKLGGEGAKAEGSRVGPGAGGHTPASVILVKSLGCVAAAPPVTCRELCTGHLGYSFLICKMGTNPTRGLACAPGCCKDSVRGSSTMNAKK